MPTINSLKVTSDVRRDLLASAALFKTPAAAVWEYVANSLQYVDRGVAPKVQVVVRLKERRMIISDNGSGMDHPGLEHFFTMHGENRERISGRMGRGKFGTGKSAAFGIATRLEVATRRAGLLNVVELTKQMIATASPDGIELHWLTRNEHTARPNGTTVTIDDVTFGRATVTDIIEYVERQLKAYRAQSPEVAVNDHVCIYREPEVRSMFTFLPSSGQETVLGKVELIVKVSQAPLPESDQGIAVTTGPGTMVAVERAGMDRKEFGSYLFGEIEVPSLDETSGPIEAYDSSRSLSLNPSHPVASVLVSFIGAKLEEVRLSLVEDARVYRQDEQAKKLRKEADKISTILNADFEQMRKRLQSIRTASASPGAPASPYGGSASGNDEIEGWVEGVSEPGAVDRAGRSTNGTGKQDRQPPDVPRRGRADLAGDASVDPVSGRGKGGRSRGGFRVDYEHSGSEGFRSAYERAAMRIIINLDHPVVEAALQRNDTEEPGFRRLSYEIAFSEYAMALGYEMANDDPLMEASDLLYEVRQALNRVSIAGASLYR